MEHRGKRRTQGKLVTAAVAVLFAVAACGGNGESAEEGTPSPPAATTTAPTSPATTPTSPATAGTNVAAELTDFKIALSQTSLSPGTYTFVVEQKGQRPHSLAIKGPGVDDAETAVIQPGGASQRLTVNLQSGEYELWCPVGNHREQGMELTLTVG